MSRLIKPRPWVFDPGLTAPEWRWFWEAFQYSELAFSGMTTVISDWKTFLLNDVSSPVSNAFGPSLTGQLESQFLTGFNGPSSWSAATVLVVCDLATTTGDQVVFQHSLSDTAVLGATGFVILRDDAVFGQPETDAFRWRVEDNSSVIDDSWTDSGVANTLGPYVFVARWRETPNATSFLVNGVEATNQSLGGAASQSRDNLRYLSINAEGAGTRAWSGGTNFVAVSPTYISDAQAQMLARDPFGPFRMFDGFPITTGAVSVFVNLSSIFAATSTYAASLDTQAGLTAALAAIGQYAAALDTQSGLDSALSATATLTSELDAQSGLDAVMSATATLAAALDAYPGLDSALSAAATLAAELDPQSGLTAALSAASTLAAALDAYPGLASVLSAAATFAGSLTIGAEVDLDAVLAATSGFSASLDDYPGFSTVLATVSSMVGELDAYPGFTASLAGLATFNASLDAQPGLMAALSAISAFLAELDGASDTDTRGYLALSDSPLYHLFLNDTPRYNLSLSDA